MVGKAAYGFEAGRLGYRKSRTISFAIVRFGLILVLILSALMAIASALLLLYGWTHNDTVFQGVTAAGADLGGLNQQQAADRIATRIQSVAPKQIVLTYGGKQWSVAASTLGISYDANSTAARSLEVGHGGSLWVQSHDWLTTLATGDQVPVEFKINDQSVYTALQGLSGSVIQSASNASYVFTSDGGLKIQEGKPGVAIDVAATVNAIRNNVANLSSEPVAIQTKSIEPDITAKTLEPELKKANEMVATPFVMVNGGTKWQIPPETLREMLVVNSSGENNSVVISSAALEKYVAQIADQVKTSGTNASVKWENDKFVVINSVDGESLDAKATTANIVKALENGQHQVNVAVTSTPAPIVESDAQAAIVRAQNLVGQPLKLTWPGGSQDLTATQMASIISFSAQPDKTPKIAIGVDQNAIASVLGSLKSKVEVPAKDANLRYLDGKVTVVSKEQAGTTLNVDASAKAIESALTGGQQSVALATDPVQPQVTAAMASTIVVKDKLGSGQTYYGGSVANRAFNVDLAVQRVNGALIPPGGTFSFDQTVGAVDSAHGYKLGYGIVATSNGSVSTVPSVGGGICQVATTLFHAAFWAGLPIVQRSWHLYWIPLYGQPPSGITGLDATIDTDVGLDLKFKNTTGNWIAVQASSDGTWVRFALYGTDPGWKVKVSDPVVTNVVKAQTAMQYEKSDQLPAGTSVLVEHAEDGFDVSIHRQVFDKSGKQIDDLNLNSHYVPSANITLQGTGT